MCRSGNLLHFGTVSVSFASLSYQWKLCGATPRYLRHILESCHIFAVGAVIRLAEKCGYFSGVDHGLKEGTNDNERLLRNNNCLEFFNCCSNVKAVFFDVQILRYVTCITCCMIKNIMLRKLFLGLPTTQNISLR